jgi:hypothetical protein
MTGENALKLNVVVAFDRGTKQKRDDDGVVEARLVRQFVALLRLFVCDFMSKFVW